MELIAYLILIFLGLVSVIFNFKSKASYWILIPIIIFWSLVMRMSEMSTDFIYYTYMMTQDGLLGVILANSTQPILYIFQWSLFKLTNNIYMTLVVSDLILLFIFCIAIANLFLIFKQSSINNNLNRFYPAVVITLLVSWPYYLGFNLTYRQFAATVIFLYSLGLIRKSKIRATLLFILSVAMHNAIAFYIPLIGFFSGNKFLRFLSYIFIILLPFILSQLSSIEYPYVGLILAAMYPLVITFLCSIALLISIGKNIKIENEFTLTFLYIPYLALLSWLLLQNGAAERFGIMSIAILMPIFLLFVLHKMRYKFLIISLILLASSLPIFIFYQSMLI